MTETDSDQTSSFDWLFKDDPQNICDEQRQALLRYRTQRLGQQLVPMDIEKQLNAVINLFDPEQAEAREKMQMVSLFLRPFKSEYNFCYSYSGKEKFLEHALNEVMGKVAPVFGFDVGNFAELDPSNKGTKSLFSADADWQNEVRAAIGICAPIFVLPSGDPGVLWEIKQLRRLNALAKTIFIMPATTSHQSRKSSEEFWGEAQRAFKREFKAMLPRFSRRGAWFTLQDDFRVKRITFDLANLYNLGQGNVPPRAGENTPRDVDENHIGIVLSDLLCDDGKFGIAWIEEEWNRRLDADESDLKSLFDEYNRRSNKRAEIAILHGLRVGEFTLEEFQSGSPETRMRVLRRAQELDSDISSGRIKPKVTKRDLARFGSGPPFGREHPKEVSGWTIFGWIVLGLWLLLVFSSN